MTGPADTLPAEGGEARDTDADADADGYSNGGETLRWVLGKPAKFRLDKWLQNNLKNVSRNQIRKLIDLGGVTVNGVVAKPSRNLREGDAIEAHLPPRPATDLEPEDIPLDILYEDDDFIVINKPAGLIVHPARSYLTGTLLNALVHHFQQAAKPRAVLSSVGKEGARPGVVHRLDLHTTGVIIVAKRDAAHAMLARQFERRTNLKVYLALVHGCPDGGSGSVGGALDQPIGKHPTIREAMAARYDSHSKDALTLYRVRERYEGYSLVEVEIKTGRTHQIRVHFQYAGCPIVGDILYGGEPVGPHEVAHPPRPTGGRAHLVFARDRATGQRIEAEARERATATATATVGPTMTTPALHAALLQITHPSTGERMTFTAPAPASMRGMIAEMRKHPAPGPVVTEGAHLDLDAILKPLAA